MKKINYILLTILLLALPILTTNLYAEKPRGYITDNAGVLSPEISSYLEALSTQVEQKTSCELALVTIQKIENQTIEGYAVSLFEEWGIGKKGQDNGVLILFSLEDRKVRIEVGYGLEEFLPDGLCGEIIRQEMVPFFKAGDYNKGLAAGLLAVVSVVGEKYNFTVSGKKSKYGKRGSYGRGRRKKGLVKGIFSLLILLLFLGGRIGFLPFLFLGGMSGRRSYWGGNDFRSGFGGGLGGGGFGGFGGGMSGGGGASGSW